MGMFDQKKSNVPKTWPLQEEGKLSIEGTVVCIDAPYELDYQTREIKRFKDGQPRRQIRLTVLTDEGPRCWYFKKAFGENVDRKAKPNHPWNACLNALDSTMEDKDVAVSDLLGRKVKVATKKGNWGLGNPKPFKVEIVGAGDTDKVIGIYETDYYTPDTIMAKSVQDAFEQIGEAMDDEIPF